MLKVTASAIGLILASLNASAACYSLYDQQSKLIYRNTSPPYSIATGEPSPDKDASFQRGERLITTNPSRCLALDERQVKQTDSTQIAAEQLSAKLQKEAEAQRRYEESQLAPRYYSPPISRSSGPDYSELNAIKRHQRQIDRKLRELKYNGRVRVKSYYKKDGTFVREHTRRR